MAITKRILLADADGRLADAIGGRVGDAGWQSTTVAGLSAARLALADGDPAILLADLRLCGDGRELAGLAAEYATPLVLGTHEAPSVPACRLALRLGAAGLVSPADDPETISAVLTAAARRGQDARRQRDELGRHEYLATKLRHRCAEQAQRFQESQDTFFLDLSRLMTIITNIMDGIVFVDRGGNVTLLNPVAENLLGTKSFVAIGKPLRAMGGQSELVEALARDHDRLQQESKKDVTQTVEVHHNEQDLVYIQCSTSQVSDYRGRPAGALSVLKDVTAEFKTDQLKNQYLSIVAHELRTPLTGIKTFSTMMTKGTLGELTATQSEVCESIREQSLRLEHQIDKLINLGSLESADYGQDRDACPVSEFAAGLLSPFEQSSRDRRIDLQFEIASNVEDREVFVDRADLRRACQALVENAVKFTPDGGTVEVSITPSEGGAPRFRVRDNGIGVDPRYQRRIFEKFFQVEDPLTRHHGGAGLGLFVAKGIVEAHGSCIEVSSQLGQGADFSFALPTRDADSTPVTEGSSEQSDALV